MVATAEELGSLTDGGKNGEGSCCWLEVCAAARVPEAEQGKGVREGERKCWCTDEH